MSEQQKPGLTPTATVRLLNLAKDWRRLERINGSSLNSGETWVARQLAEQLDQMVALLAVSEGQPS